MPRLLSNADNTLRITDNISGSEIELYYRLPTTAEHTAYQNECIQRRGKKVRTRYPETRLKYGKKILTGFRAGDFVIEDGQGGTRAIASEEGHADYFEGWRGHVEKYAADLVQLLAGHVFEQPADIEEDFDDRGDAVDPD